MHIANARVTSSTTYAREKNATQKARRERRSKEGAGRRKGHTGPQGPDLGPHDPPRDAEAEAEATGRRSF